MAAVVVGALVVSFLSLVAAGCSGNGAAQNAADTSMAGMQGMEGMDMSGSDSALTVTAAERARLGIIVVPATTGELVRDVRLVGRVVPAETAVRTVTTKVDGFVERLYVDFTGREVRRGEPLMDVYSPMLVAAQEELLLAVRLRATLGRAASVEAIQQADSLVAAARRRLEYWDIDAAQIAELERSGATRRTLTLRAPVNGVVLEKNVVQGQAIMTGAPLLQIADLGTIWIEADAFETDLGVMRAGLRAEVEFDAYPGERFTGRVTYVYPTLDPVARTGKVRIEFSNPRGRLRPGLFGTVRIAAPSGARGVLIPRQAALITGDRQLVFVEDASGRFRPRLVTLGMESDSMVQVRSGLAAGERVVATAAFLLDAESNLGAAMAGMAGMAGMDMPATGAGTGAPQQPPPAPRPRRPAPDSMPGMRMPEHRQH
ncbi:MAG TPA: efflux RND transporter periplasmic adaptor subunit [Gemmatimonadales bacterium]|nr:efflux RND transporter periplasmic adaptor subunit [Gemmatimonadales bacterium]